MSWKYGIIKSKEPGFIIGAFYNWYEVVEVYDGDCYADSLTVSGESVDEIIEILETMLSDLKTNPKIIEKEKND